MSWEPTWDVWDSPEDDDVIPTWETRDLALATYLSLTLPVRQISRETNGETTLAWWSFDDTDELQSLIHRWEGEPIVNARVYELRLRLMKRSIYHTDAAAKVITKE